MWPVDPGRPRLWDIDALVRDTERARAELTARSSSFDVDAPVEELRAAQRAADVAGTRLLLVGGEGAALLLAFTVLAARGMRRDLEQARRRLTWFGARRWQLGLLSGVESAGVAVAGVVVGWLLGIAVAGVAASLAGAPVDDVLRESVLSPRGLALAGATVVAAAVLVWITVSLPTRKGARLQGVDLVAIAALLVAGVTLASGAADEDQLARGEGSALLLLLLPGLLAVVAAIAVARVFPAIARWWSERRRSALSARLAAVGLARGPGGAVATVAFLTIAFALALLAGGYRATLVQGERDQAAFEVPLDVVVREDLQNLVRVFDVAPERSFARLAGKGRSLPCSSPDRRRGTGGTRERRDGLGLDPAAIERVGVWRPEWSSGRGLKELAELVDPGHPVELRGLRLPGDRIVLGVSPSVVSFAAIVRLPDGAFRRIAIGAADPRSRCCCASASPRSVLVSLEIVPPPRLIERGADSGNAFVADLRLSGRLATELRDWVGVGGVVTSRRPPVSGSRSPHALPKLLPPLAATDRRLARVGPRDPAPRRARRWRRWRVAAPARRGDGPGSGGRDRPRFPGATGDVVVGDRASWGPRSTRPRRAAHGRTRSGSTSRPTGSTRSRPRSRGRPIGRSRRRCGARSRPRRTAIHSPTERCSR